MLRRMARFQAKEIAAENQARMTLTSAGASTERADVEAKTGVDAGVLIAALKERAETREALAIALFALKSEREDHSQAREREKNAVAVSMGAATTLSGFL